MLVSLAPVIHNINLSYHTPRPEQHPLTNHSTLFHCKGNPINFWMPFMYIMYNKKQLLGIP